MGADGDRSREDALREEVVIDDGMEGWTFAGVVGEDFGDEFLGIRRDRLVRRKFVVVVLDSVVDRFDVAGLEGRPSDK